MSETINHTQEEFAPYVIPYSESERLAEIAARMRKISPTLTGAALNGMSIESDDEA